MYKLSKFTYHCINSSNELLFYNTLIGKRSLCKLPSDYVNIENLLSCVNDDKNYDSLTKRLLFNGIIVEESEDENKKLYDSFLSNVSPTILTLHINPTEDCNFRCKYCYETFSHGPMSNEVQKDIVAFVRQNIHRYTGLTVSWFGGEPLTAVDCMRYLTKKFMEICNYYRIPYTALITTNGYLLNQTLFNELLDMNIKNYQITIDGIKDIHDYQRVTKDNKGTFKTIVGNLHNLHLNNKKDFEILIRTNITKEIFDRLDEYINTLHDICQNDDRFSIAFYKVGNWLSKANKTILPKIINNIDELQLVYDKLLNSNFSSRINFTMYYPGNGSCYAGKRNMFLIRANGNIHKCTVDFEQPGTQVGKLDNGKMILNEKYYSNIIDINKCNSFYECSFAPICMGTPCPNDNKGGCPYTKKYLLMSLKILDKNYPLELIDMNEI